MHTTPEIHASPVFVAAVYEDQGCGGGHFHGYLKASEPVTRKHLDSVVLAAGNAGRGAASSYDREHPLGPAPVFNASWAGTAGELKAAQAEHRAKQAARTRERARAAAQAERETFAEAGIAEFELVAGELPTVGGPYDDIETPVIENGVPGPAGHALMIVKGYGCRCGGGWFGLADDAEDDDVTPRSWEVTVTSGTNERTFITATVSSDEIVAALADADAAAADAVEAVDDARRRWELRTSTTAADLDAMTFQQRQQFDEQTKIPHVGWTVSTYAGLRHGTATPDWDRILADETARRRAGALSTRGIFEVGRRQEPERDW